MKYNCELCDYYTENRTCFYQHKLGQKHKEKVNKQTISTNLHQIPPFNTNIDISTSEEKNSLICEYCNSEFSRKDALLRHQNNRCTNKKLKEEVNEVKIESILKEKEFIQKQFEELKKEKEELKKEKEELKQEKEKEKEELKKEKEELKREKEEEKKKLEDQLLYYRDVLYNKSENDCNITNMNFINKHYQDAPVLEGPKNLHKLFIADKTAKQEVYYENLARELGSHQRLKILHKVISDFIVKDYCKEDKSKQSMWNSDSSRLNYIIKECIQKDKIWVMDKSGKNLLEKVIRPIIDYMKVDLVEAQKYIISYDKNGEFTFMDMEDHKMLTEVLVSIANKTLEENILKELTQHFNINQKLLLKDIKDKNKLLDNKDKPKLLKDKEKQKEEDIKTKLNNILKEVDDNLVKIRKEEENIDSDNESDDDKLIEIKEKKRELKIKKKQYKQKLKEYEEIEEELDEIVKKEEEISSDTESEREEENKRQLKILKTTRKKMELEQKKKEFEKQIIKLFN